MLDLLFVLLPGRERLIATAQPDETSLIYRTVPTCAYILSIFDLPIPGRDIYWIERMKPVPAYRQPCFLPTPPPPLYSKGNSGCAAFSYRGLFSLTWLSLTYLTQRLEYRFHTARVIGSNPIVGKTGRTPCFCQHDSKHGLAARSQLNDQSIGCFHLWPSSTALTP